MADDTLTQKTARELASLIATRSVSPVEVLDAHLAAIERKNSSSTPSSRLQPIRRGARRAPPKTR